jgi:hypothetical protein
MEKVNIQQLNEQSHGHGSFQSFKAETLGNSTGSISARSIPGENSLKKKNSYEITY